MISPQLKSSIWVKPLFVEEDGTQFEAPSVAKLIAIVANYRKENGKVFLTTAADVVAQLCQRHPHACVWPKSVPQPVNKPQSRGELNGRILDWVADRAEAYMKGRLRYVKDKREVERRSKVCASCPRQKAWAKSCSACRAEVARLEQEILSPTGPLGTSTRQAEALLGCAVLGEDPRVSVYLDEQGLGDNSLPGNCWRK